MQQRRAAALETFHMEQLAMLQDQLAKEKQESAFRERVQIAMGAKLDAEARQKTKDAIARLKEQLDHNEALDYVAAPVDLH